MEHDLTIRVSDEVFSALAGEAAAHGAPVESFASKVVTDRYRRTLKRPPLTAEEARQRLLTHIGSVDLGHATGADNESIDADLARAYEQQGH